MKKRLVFIANWTQGSHMSGGDRIWTEFVRIWQSSFRIVLVGSDEAAEIARRQGLWDFEFIRSSPAIRQRDNLSVMPLLVNTVRRVFSGLACVMQNRKYLSAPETIAVYSTSDFWPDSLPALALKLLSWRLTWIAGFYLFAPVPWKKESPYKGSQRLKGLFFFLSQLPLYLMARTFADRILVTSEPDVTRFVTRSRDASRVIVVRGGVDTAYAEEYLSSWQPSVRKEYDACFVGRFHCQKGVIELVDIWERVVRRSPGSCLAMVGDGELKDTVEALVRERGLERNITLLGFLDGERKHEVFRSSRVIVHPATFDSGGMAAAEGMAWGLPAVSFDLEALKSYYPRGMLKAVCFDHDSFAALILQLLYDRELYNRTRQDAIALSLEWDWKKRSMEILSVLNINGVR